MTSIKKNEIEISRGKKEYHKVYSYEITTEDKDFARAIEWIAFMQKHYENKQELRRDQ